MIHFGLVLPEDSQKPSDGSAGKCYLALTAIHRPPAPPKGSLQHGSLHYTPEHCLVNGGVQLYFGVEKATCFKWKAK